LGGWHLLYFLGGDSLLMASLLHRQEESPWDLGALPEIVLTHIE